MSKIVLKKMVLKNFKGIKSFVFEPSEKETKVFGDNGVGKTTLRNAYLWCLTGRDSENRHNHEIKPLDKDNNPIHHLESSVELYLEKEGKKLNIKRVFKEQWSRKTGEVDKTFDGNTTEYYQDSVKLNTKSAFDKAVMGFYDLNLIQLLSDPVYFINLKWQEQRDYLFSLIEVNDKEVEASDDKLQGFSSKFNTSNLDTERKSLNAKKRDITKDIQDSEAKREENINSQIEPKDWGAIEKEIADNKKKLSEIDVLIQNKAAAFVKAKNDANELYIKKYNELSSELNKIKTDKINKLNESRIEYRDKKRAVSDEVNRLSAEIESIKSDNNRNARSNELVSAEIAKLEESRNKLLDEYKEIKAREFNLDPICSTCGAVRGDIDSYKVEMEKKFNDAKAADLESNINIGKNIARRIDELKADIRELKGYKELEENLKKAKEVLDKFPEYVEPDFKDADKKIVDLNKKMVELSNKSISEVKDEDTEELNSQKEAIRATIESLNMEMYDKKAFDATNERIQALEHSIRSSSLALADIDKQMFLINLFEKNRNEICEKKINAKFEMVTFTLFEYLNDGTPKPNCQALYKGVPASTLNTGAKINVGLDVIRTFSGHFRESYPVFIDNKESVTKTIDIDNQVINLIVKEGQKELLVENK